MTGLPWLRLYTEYATDPKIQILAFDDQRHFVMLLCLKGNGTLDCVLPNESYRERMIAKALGLDAGTAVEVKRRLVEGGLINEQWAPLAWDARQMKSDHNAHERTERYRANREANGLPRVSKVNERFWDQIFQRDGGKCVYCDSTDQLLLDHMVPIKHGGTDDIDNLALACKRCNCGKAGRTPELAGYEIADSARFALERYRGRHAGDTMRHALDKTREDKTREDKTEPKRAREARPVPRKRVPVEFQITDDLRAWAKANAPDVDVNRETERMRDWEYKSGRSDWPAAWRTWMDRAQSDLANRPGRKSTRRAKTADELDAEWEAANAKH